MLAPSGDQEGSNPPASPVSEATPQGSQWDNHFKSHYNVSLTGTDADGLKYVGDSTGNGKGETFGVPPEDMVISTVIVSQGGSPNFVTKIVLHFAKDGTINVEKGGEECRGRI